MDANPLSVGIQGYLETLVTVDKTAVAYGSGTVEVYATPAMIAFMEQTSMESVMPFLNPGEVTVGTEVHVSHLKATLAGEKVVCRSELVAIANRQLTFEVEASDGQGVIGRGTHTRLIVDQQKFMRKLLDSLNNTKGTH